jgi:hypothetical protein
LIAPSTCSLLASFLFNLVKIILMINAMSIANAAVAQSTLIGIVRSAGPLFGCGYI